MDCNSVGNSAVTTTTLCVRKEDVKNVNPTVEPSTSLALVANNNTDIVSPDEEAVCAINWHPGIPENHEEASKCPSCGLGLLRWYYISEENSLQMCNNVLCNYPFGCDQIKLRPNSTYELQLDSNVTTVYEAGEHYYYSRSSSVAENERPLSPTELRDEMESLIAKYIGNEADSTD